MRGNDVEEPDKKKSRCQQCQSRFFQQRQEIVQTHPHIVEWFDGAGSKEMKKDIIEKCFKKDAGRWKLDLDKPYFKESKQRCVNIMEAYGTLGVYNFRICSV